MKYQRKINEKRINKSDNRTKKKILPNISMITPRHQHIQLVKPLMPAENEGPRRRARPRDMSAARPLTSVCHAGVWGGVSTAHPRPDGTKRGTRREQRGQGNASGGREKRRGDR